jgi:hypothetical protein
MVVGFFVIRTSVNSWSPGYIPTPASSAAPFISDVMKKRSAAFA